MSNWSVDSSKLTNYQDNQLVRYQDIHKLAEGIALEMPFDSGTIEGSNLLLSYTNYGIPYSFSIASSIASIVDSSLVLITNATTSIEIPGLTPILDDIFKTGIFTISYYVNSTGGANTAVDILSTYPVRKVSNSGLSSNGISTFIGNAGHDVKFSFGTSFVTNSSGYGVIKIGNKNWVKITCVVNGTNLSIYEGNTLRDSRTIPRFTGCMGSNFYLAHFAAYSGNTIKLKKVKIFDKALDANEITLL